MCGGVSRRFRRFTQKYFHLNLIDLCAEVFPADLADLRRNIFF